MTFSIDEALNDITLQKLQNEIVEWANQEFPNRTPQSGFMKLFEEVGEILRDPRDHSEWADVFIMLLDIANHYDVSGDDLNRAIINKMDINRKRKWVKNEVGVMQHVAEGVVTESMVVGVPIVIVNGAHEGNHTLTIGYGNDMPQYITMLSEDVIMVYSRASDYDAAGRCAYIADRIIE